MPDTTLELDPAADDAPQRLLQALDALAPGDALTLYTTGAPRPLAKYLAEQAWGRFDWQPLTAGDGDWRTVVRKRADPGPQRVSAFMTADHRRCDALYVEAENAANAGNAKRAQSLFRFFETAMARHFAMEEQGLFPDLERRMGFPGQGPTSVMREEHTQMRGVIAAMEQALAEGDTEGFLDGGETLLILMEQHNMKEEEMLYAMMDEAFAGEEDTRLKQLLLY